MEVYVCQALLTLQGCALMYSAVFADAPLGELELESDDESSAVPGAWLVSPSIGGFTFFEFD